MRECSILRKDESAGGEDEATVSLELGDEVTCG